MRTTRLGLMQATLMVLGLPAVLSAGPILDFSTLSVNDKITNLGAGETALGPVAARAFKQNSSTMAWSATTLIARDENNDHGLGVCSEGLTNCNIGGTGGGDINELGQQSKQEAILLKLTSDWQWSQLWVSSLDSGGTGGHERGRVHWGNSSDVPTLLQGSSFGFQSGDFAGGKVEGNILSLASAALFDRNARYALFVPGGAKGHNNDYLVYGASVERKVPEPALIGLLGMAAVFIRRRRRRMS